MGDDVAGTRAESDSWVQCRCDALPLQVPRAAGAASEVETRSETQHKLSSWAAAGKTLSAAEALQMQTLILL